ncbi:MAG: histidine phosphatase family protein [Thiothrix sp.]|uniref:histidine phosphatase family protein n=1 Tax=Thiothrix sp. TaxID=1032 RepID=UPI002627C37D|nr:histidine phosphatase family protein [Thiothrix sp.]MDD5394179.1 histidine phosphatase family protein [Thiothrix sp.]
MRTIIDLLRHGEPEGGNMYRGSGTDHSLSERGWQQMWAAIEGKGGWDAIVTSPMSRCHAFASAVAEKYGLPLEVIPDLREAGYGAWEGLRPEDIQATQPEAYRALYADPLHCRPQGAEPLETFAQRVTQAFAQVQEQYAGKHILLVSHAGTMRAIAVHLLGAPITAQQRISLSFAAFFAVHQDDFKGVQLVF